MSLRLAWLGLRGTVGTWFNFARGPCLWFALVAAVLAGGGIGWVTKAVMDGKIARAELATAKAEKDLSEFTGQLATSAAQTEREVGQMIAYAEQRIALRDAEISARVAAIPGEVARQMRDEFTPLFRRALDADPVLADCLDRPLPRDAVRLLEREARAISATDSADPDAP